MVRMKKGIKALIYSLPVIIAIIAGTLAIWKCDDKAEHYEIESFVLINNIPYIVREGTAYYWDDDQRAWIVYREGVKELFQGESECVLKADGSLEVCADEYSDSNDTQPLGVLYNTRQANNLLDISRNTPIRTLNREVVSGKCWALCEDGSMLINPGEEYIPLEIPDETIKDISGNFVLTEAGNVYRIDNVTFGTFSCKQISEDRFTAIAACESAPRCVGIRDDNTAVMWSDLEPLNLTSWKNVKEIAVGFNYCVGLSQSGKVLYADYVKNRETDVSGYLRGIKAEHITCCYETIAIIKNDGSVEMIDISK